MRKETGKQKYIHTFGRRGRSCNHRENRAAEKEENTYTGQSEPAVTRMSEKSMRWRAGKLKFPHEKQSLAVTRERTG